MGARRVDRHAEELERGGVGLLYDALEALLPVAEERGVILALETYVGHVLKTQGQLSGLLDRFPTEHLQVVCDLYNYLSSALVPDQDGVTSRLFDRFEPRFVLAHLKDVSPTALPRERRSSALASSHSRRTSSSCVPGG